MKVSLILFHPTAFSPQFRRNMNCGDIAPDNTDLDGLDGADEGDDPGDELNVTALGLDK